MLGMETVNNAKEVKSAIFHIFLTLVNFSG